MHSRHDKSLTVPYGSFSTWRKGVALIFGLLTAVMLVGCGERAVMPAYPMPMTAAVPENPPVRGDYRLAVGDILDIKFFYNPELNDSNTMIRPDGKISLPLVGDIQAKGRTPDELKQILQEHYRGIVRNPEISVMVRKFTTVRVYVGGEVKAPGMQPLDGKITALQAIMQAGGFNHDAQRDSVIVLKNSASAKSFYQLLDLEPRVDRPIVQDQVLDPFDIVFVPQKRIAEVAQFFKEYFNEIFPIYRNMAISFPFFYTLNPQVVTPITK